jgi:hypothetical protein
METIQDCDQLLWVQYIQLEYMIDCIIVEERRIYEWCCFLAYTIPYPDIIGLYTQVEEYGSNA